MIHLSDNEAQELVQALESLIGIVSYYHDLRSRDKVYYLTQLKDKIQKQIAKGAEK